MKVGKLSKIKVKPLKIVLTWFDAIRVKKCIVNIRPLKKVEKPIVNIRQYKKGKNTSLLIYAPLDIFPLLFV